MLVSSFLLYDRVAPFSQVRHIPGGYTMTESFSTFRINPDRMLDTFNQLALIGATGDGGVSRVTFSEEHLLARKWFREQIEASGFEFRTDSAGNHSAFLVCGKLNVSTLLFGSHLDSVPNGGRGRLRERCERAAANCLEVGGRVK